MKRKTILILAGLATMVHANSYDVLLKRYEHQIRQQERQLQSLKTHLAEKEREAQHWQKKAEDAKALWTRANASAEQTRRTIQTVRGHRNTTRVLANAAESSATEMRLTAQTSDGLLAYWARELYLQQRLSRTPPVAVQERLPGLLTAKLCDFSQTAHWQAAQAGQQESSLRLQELRWQDEEQRRTAELDRLHSRQQSQWLRWQEAQRRRAALVDEISQMEQSRQALHVMLQELQEHRDHTLASRQGHPAENRALAALRGTLPWPADGKVTQNFGRQYSEDLKQLMISNGIKIDAGANRQVRAIQAGKVLFANPFRQYGQLVIVQHANGLTSVYGGLGQTSVKEGCVLSPLEPIGLTGGEGTFYFELRHDEQPVNPLVYLAANHHRSELSSRRTFE
ncbi:MAG: peptidoglycan DD-metalloendopeptidase family protein [Elusimicrobiota bacterium]